MKDKKQDEVKVIKSLINKGKLNLMDDFKNEKAKDEYLNKIKFEVFNKLKENIE